MSATTQARQPHPGPSQGHSSRRDTPSISSNHSSSGRDRARERAHPAMESAVTRLLVSIKALLESLTQWSAQQIDELTVSDVYVRFGNDFNTAVAAFASFNIDMSELVTVPDDLRLVLEQCLSEDATPDNLEIYLPNVRKIITDLLQGLREKQTAYRKVMTEHRRQTDGHERTESRSSRSRRDGAHRPESTRTINGEDGGPRDSVRRSGHTSMRRRDIMSQSSQASTAPTLIGEEQPQQFIGGFAPMILEEQTGPPSPGPYAPPPPPSTTDSIPPQHRRQPSAAVSISERSLPPPPESPQPEPAPTEAAPLPVNSPVPASVKRYSLVDKPITTPPPPVVVEPSSPEIPLEQISETSSQPSDPPSIENVPAVADSLAALKKSDALERRASKRFSTYNISKITNSGVKGSLRGNPNRRSFAASNALTPGELAVLTEVDDEESSVYEARARSRSASRPTTPPPVPPLPTSPSRTPEPVAIVESVAKPAPSTSPRKIPVFLQLGREVKKVVVEPGLSFAGLRMLFVDKFAYNPGLEDFPAIYIRDPSSGVQYELEDVDEVKEKCLLSLNIEPLDQIKQHIDSQISSLHQDIKDLKSTISNQRVSTQLPHIVTQPLAESTPVPRPSDRQFQTAARRLSRFVGDSSFMAQSVGGQPDATPPASNQVLPQTTGQSLQTQMTGASAYSDYTSRVVTDLRTQFDEVQNLRRDIGVMRQLYTDFMKQTKDSLGTLRNQTQNVKQLASSSVGGARAYIDSGKQKLDMRSQNVLTDVEKLQDLVENIKDDVIRRQVTPKPQYFKTIKKDIEKVAAELESLKEHIKTIKPMWKSTWEEELQNIVEEQQFLNHQEEFLADLLEDYKAVVEVYGHVEQVVNLRGTNNGLPRGGRRGYRPPPPDEGHNGLSTVMQEIRGAAVDPERRLKAIEANKKNREKALAAREDDLQTELTEFVGQKKLKMTGGAEEVERVRQKRNDMTLKAMFTGGSISSFAGTVGDGTPNGGSPISPTTP
ncbi:AIP3-domain-containing protein [Macrolepiota fuliginosa MF-IS2]|uniref:AIP3-domain-containing protein n=1 Tax=Macrolepiota fuliginosa MF-IS2 TaxID=1400762 RepID=A0A9P5XPV6_9AGAR|nr:AIP3-domain-containing protein [Macrolepiota fuliginosa MF-IS2]